VPAAAQVEAGDSLRFKVVGRYQVDGSLLAWRADTLLVRLEGVKAAWPIPYSDLEMLQVFRLRTPSEGFHRGMLIGATAGLFIGVAVGLGLHAAGVIDDPDAPPAEKLIANGLTFMGFGIASGFFVGGFIGSSHPGIGWVNIRIMNF
jgi:hypothetical protein